MKHFFAMLLFFGTVPAIADVITFETAPDGSVPIDDSLLATPYNSTGGTVRFFYDLNGNNNYDSGIDELPAFEAAGKDAVNAFASDFDNSADRAKPGFEAQLGNFFLRTAGIGPTGTRPPDPPGPFIMQCITTGTITAFSGEIWDIDGGTKTEQFRIEVLSKTGGVLASELSPLGDSEAFDSLPWQFTFAGLPSSAESVRITYIGTKSGGVGFAYNNFGVTFVPEPSTLTLLALGVVGLAVMRRTALTAPQRSPGLLSFGASGNRSQAVQGRYFNKSTISCSGGGCSK